MKPIRILTLFSLILLPIISPAQIVTNRWTGGSDADWFNPNNWSLTQIPQAGQAVVLDDGFVTAYTNILLTQSTPALASLEITNRLLTFSNWSTFLSATTITLRSSATLTLPAAFPNGAMSNRIYLICSNFTMETGSRIDADGRGFAGYYQGAQGTGNGPGGGSISSGWGAGGGHGGRGGYPQSTTATRGAINGSVLDPNTGSGGGGGTQYGVGGHGGGLVRIDATGTLTLNGLITANGGGAAGYPSGGGSGGGVRLECWRVDSTSTGIIQAIGGNGGTPGDARGGRGGGGRIVIQYNPLAQQTLGPPAIRLAAYGAATGAAYAAEAGTLFISDQQFLVPPIPGTNAQIYGVTNWTLSSLTFTGYSWILNGPSVHVQITNTLMVGTNGFLSLHLGNTRLDCSTIILTNGGRLSLHSGPTNAATPAYGALVSVTNEIWVGANSWLYPYSDPTNGGSLLFRVKDVILSATNGGIDATGAGFAALKGYGAGATDVSQYGGGGGYGGKGGKGGNTNPSGGAPYGPTNPPIHPGSGAGGAYLGIATGAGGGWIGIEALNQVLVNGVLRANGGAGTVSGNGGGSGGGIYISCPTFTGSTNSLLEARGGNGQANGGGGGGGRIGIWVGISAARAAQIQAGNFTGVTLSNTCPSFAGAISITNGTGFFNGPPNGAEAGTCWFLIADPAMGVMIQIL